jgi:hypothetical protein
MRFEVKRIKEGFGGCRRKGLSTEGLSTERRVVDRKEVCRLKGGEGFAGSACCLLIFLLAVVADLPRPQHRGDLY